MKAFLGWLDARTGAVTFTRRILFDPLPGSVGWRHCWGSVLVFMFLVQMITGFFLLAGYSASTQTAWESVYHLQFETRGGWLLRGLHVVAAQAFVILLGLHLMQVVIQRTYLAPRELNLLLLLVLLPLALAQSVTGWLLPLDQKGYWAARVPLNILAVVPGIGPLLQQALLGGPEVGHHTLTRFLALHVTVLPLALGGVLAVWWYLARRSSPSAAGTAGAGKASWWPEQALRDAVACLVVVVTLLLVVVRPGFDGRGVAFPELLAPVDPVEPYSAARPEWFMLFLFQFLKYFPAGSEVWGAVIIPSLILLVMAAMPWVGRWRLGAGFNTVFVLALGLGAVVLAGLALREDRSNTEYQAARRQAHTEAARARELVQTAGGIPETGALTLLRADPLLQGPRLFARHCASCHRYDGHDGLGQVPTDAPSASDLKGFASREWLTGLLDPQRVATPHYFGGTRFEAGRMVRFVQKDVAAFDDAQRANLAKVILAVSAEAELPAQREADLQDADAIAAGRELIRTREMKCTNCHQFRVPDEDAIAPDLTGYGSRAWLVDFVGHPAHVRFYGRRNDRMPSFGRDEILDEQALGLLADWLRGEWHRPAPAVAATAPHTPRPE